ncbi:unnamed protein product [Zymoseptoria tritici ST99CH_1E4]|uniref:Uncharacterized protein n=1 Tax=Zymoseptoria tritici ST99CH_1E4 TaxID=1276532 RepID=A0A2H1FZL7_ZYMTR|nr:unnamed protein product [Zymoseptoria tritici ST99CH_1E4]
MSRYTSPHRSRRANSIIVLDSSPEPEKHDAPSEPVDVKPVMTGAQTAYPDSSSSPIIELPQFRRRRTTQVARKTAPKPPVSESELELDLERSPTPEQEIRYEPLRRKRRITVARKTARKLPALESDEESLEEKRDISPEPEFRPSQARLHLSSQGARKSASKLPQLDSEEASDSERIRTTSYDDYIMAEANQDDASPKLITGKTEIGDSEAEISFNAEVSPHATQPVPNADTMIEASWGFSHLDGMEDVQQTVTLEGLIPSKRKVMSIGALLAPQPEANVAQSTMSNVSATSSGSPPSKRLRTYTSPSDNSDKAQSVELADSTATSLLDASRSLDHSGTTPDDEDQDNHLPDASDLNTTISARSSLNRKATPEPSADPPEPASSSPLSEVDPSFFPKAPPSVQGPNLRPKRRVQPTTIPKPRPQPIRIQPSRTKAPSTAPPNTLVRPPPPHPKRTQAPRTNLASSQTHNTLSQQTLPSASTSYAPDSDIDAGDNDVPAHSSALTASRSTLLKTRRELVMVKQHFQEACRDWERRSDRFRAEAEAANTEAKKFKNKYFNELNVLVEKKVEKARKQLTQEFQAQLEEKQHSKSEKRRNGRGKKSRTEVEEVYREVNVAMGRLLQVDPSFADRIAGFDPEVEAALREAVARRNGVPPAQVSKGMELARAGRAASSGDGTVATQNFHDVAVSVMKGLADDVRSTIDNLRTNRGDGGVADIQNAARKKIQANLEAAETALAEGFATASSSAQGAPLTTRSGMTSPSIPPPPSRTQSMQRSTPAATSGGDPPFSSPTTNAIATVAEFWQSEASGKFTKALQATVRGQRETNKDLSKKLEEQVNERRDVERKLNEEGKAREELEGKMAEMQEKFGEMQAKLAEMEMEAKEGQGGGRGAEGEAWGWGL